MRDNVLQVMVSSTALDLPEHRAKVIDCIQRLKMMPWAMEHLPADPRQALPVSLEMVDQADIYVGVFGRRYGFVPDGQERSITELEYERARERNLPCLIFISAPEHLWTEADVETGEGATRLAALVERLRKQTGWSSFASAEQLGTLVMQALVNQRSKLVEGSHGDGDRICPDPTYLRDLGQYVTQRLRSIQIRDIEQDYIPRRLRVTGPAEMEEPGCGEADWQELLSQSRGVVLQAAAGAGKSATCLVMIQGLLKNSEQGKPGVPILIECRKLATRVMAQVGQLASPGREVIPVLRATLLGDLGRPFGLSGGSPATVDQLRRASAEFAITICIEGFDELGTTAGRDCALKERFVECLDSLLNQWDLSSIKTVISSRAPEAELLALFRFPRVELAPLGHQEITAFIQHRYGIDPERAEGMTRVFIERLAGRPLYLGPLVRRFAQIDPGQIDRVALLKAEIEAQLADNSDRCWRDAAGELQRACLRELALLELRQGSIARGPLRERLQALTPEPEVVDQLEQVLPRFLEPEGTDWSKPTGYRFPHFDFRDYWLADWFVATLLSGGATSESERVVEAMSVSNVYAKAAEMLHERSPAERSTVREQLIEVIHRDRNVQPDRRRTPTAAAIALGMLVRTEDLGLLGKVCFRDRCFQGFDGSDQRIEDVCLDGSSLRDSDLRGARFANCSLVGANLDNADLNGTTFENVDLRRAVFKNAGIGRLECASGDRPTRMRGVQLRQSNWFNFRISLSGYFQFWDARLLPPSPGTPGDAERARSARLALSTSRGEIWVMDLVEGAAPRILATGHQADIMDFDFSPERGLLATASRDRTVRLFSVDPLWQALERRGVVDGFAHPPRNVAISHSGDWVTVTDRSNQVLFYPTDQFARMRPSDSSCRTLHRGPVLCLASLREGGREVFFTSGYDGRVVRHRSSTRPGGDWASEELLHLTLPGNPSEPDTIRVASVQVTEWGTGLWIGGEGRWLYFLSLGDFGSGDVRTHRLREFEAEIFRLGRASDNRTIAVGLANGTIQVLEIDWVEGVPNLRERETITMPRSDIVRFAEFLDDDRIVCVSWAGNIRLWSRSQQAFEFEYEFPESDWRPGLDARALQISPASEVDGIVNLSGTFKHYIQQIPCLD